MKSPDNESLENVLSGPKMSYPKNTLYELFVNEAERHPDYVAIEFENQQLTYSELTTKINQMSNYLWSQGLRPNRIAAVSLNRTPELIVTIYAILQCGAVYLPLDTEYPENRIYNALQDSDASFFISRFSIVSPTKIKYIDIDFSATEINSSPSAPLKIKMSPKSIAYIIYTSGSTGQPKGVQISHSNVVNFVYSMKTTMGVNEKDKFLSVTSISFDPMVLDVFVSLLLGARVVFINNELKREGEQLLKKIIEHKITIFAGTPSIWEILLDSGWENQINLKAITGGEALHKSLANSLLSKCSELWNQYGPTETTVASFVCKISKDDDIITIGKPIANTTVYLLDSNRKPVNEGQLGEIVIAGDGVSSGYLNRPELNNERFLNNTFDLESTGKMYLTGDLGRLLPNGEVECRGRIDDQVKVRGHRIELGEIEAALNSISSIIQSAVIVHNYDENKSKIIAYLKSKELLQDEKQIRNTLSKILPQSFIPSKYIWIDEFPTTPNGKIDKKSLPIPEYADPDSASLSRKHRTAIGGKIAKFCVETSNTIKTAVVQKSLDTNLPLVSDVSLFSSSTNSNIVKTKESKKDSILIELAEIIKNISGINCKYDTVSNTFLELGLDSLSQIQLASKLKKEFNLPITFRQLNEAFSSPLLLAEYICANGAPENLIDSTTAVEMVSNDNETFSSPDNAPLTINPKPVTEEQIEEKIAILSQKRDLLQSQKSNSINEPFLNNGLNIETLQSGNLENKNKIEKHHQNKPEETKQIIIDKTPPPGARLGRDEEGIPAWFIEDSNKSGEYIKINL